MGTEVLPPIADAAPTGCHHCGAPLGAGSTRVSVSGREVPVCGEACRAAADTITNAGLDAWYRLRTHSDAQGAATADPRHRAEVEAWRVPELERLLVRPAGEGMRHGDAECAGSSVTLTVEGMRCAGCAWLVERLLTATPGVSAATVDFPLRRAEVRFDAKAARLHTLLETLAAAGYRAAPYTPHAEEAAIESERRSRIRGLGISALFGMQVMLLSIALYASDGGAGMDPAFEQLFRWLAMTLTVPVLVWPGRAFFTGAAAAIRGRRLTMDVPVALGLSIAFAGSAFATITGSGEIWFDSVVMFVTLLSGARYLELLARRRASAAVRALARSAPLVATRVRKEDVGGTVGDDSEREVAAAAASKYLAGPADAGSVAEPVPAAALRPRDRVRIRSGEVVPADGVIRSGHAEFDEALLTGESNPIARSVGGRVLAGSVSRSGVVEIEVTRAGDSTVLAGVLQRAEQAARERPAIALLADRAAAWFIGGVLVLAAGVSVGWMLHDPSRVIPVLVSVLVITCPCALSLATPTAMTAALSALARVGLIVTRANAVERLALATHCLADKTGTLTEGQFRLRSVSALAGVSESRCLSLAAALERYATHPTASAIVAAAEGRDAATVEPGDREHASVREDLESGTRETGNLTAGREADGCTPRVTPAAGRAALEVTDASAHTGGIAGRVDGARLAVGSLQFVVGACGLDVDVGSESRFRCDDDGGTHVYLAGEDALLARFVLSDALRADARELIDGLRARDIETTIASGDSAGPVERAADALGVPRHLSGLSPEEKLDETARLAAKGERVIMLGDGVNDAPALAGAHVSVAMGCGAAAAAARADAVLIGDGSGTLLAGLDIARRARRIVKQNLAWALGYNLVALPLAAAGIVPPWAAAIGMSLSSLAVAGNALRVGRTAPARGR